MRQFEPAKPRTLVRIDQVNDEDEPESYQIQCQPNLADLDLVRGPAVEPKDIRVGIINPLGSRVSGVLRTSPLYHFIRVTSSIEKSLSIF